MNLVKILDELCSEIENDDSYVDQARLATDAINELQRGGVNRLAAIKTSAIRALFEQGWTVGEIASEIGISRARVHQLIDR